MAITGSIGLQKVFTACRSFLVTVGAEMRAEAKQCVKDFAGAIRARSDFRSLTLLGHDSARAYGAFVLWDTVAADKVIAGAVSDLEARLGDMRGKVIVWDQFEGIEPAA